MAIVSILRDYGVNPSMVRIVATSPDDNTTVSAAGYITSQAANIEACNAGNFEWNPTDEVLVNIGATVNDEGQYVGGTNALFQISGDFTSLIPLVFSTTVIGTPVVVGNFAVFASTSGNLEDLGYVPTNAGLTEVTMQNGASVIGNIPVYNDVTGTLIDSGTSLASGTQKSTVALSAAQFNAMYTTPIQAVPAPGTGLLAVVEKSYLVQTYGTAQFTGGGAILLQYEATAHGAGVPASTTLAAATVNGTTASTVFELVGPASIVFAAAENEPVYISNQTAVFATGDSTFSLVTFYHNIAI